MYSLKIDATKSNAYRDIEKGVAKFFQTNGFNVISANYLCDSDGNYITAPTLKNLYKGLPGESKQVNHDDVALMADCIMSCDFLLDCGSFVVIVDITRSMSFPVSFQKMRAKQNMMKMRLGRAINTGLGVKVYNPVNTKYVVKPITKGLIIGLDYLESLDIDLILDELDHETKVRFIRFFNGSSI